MSKADPLKQAEQIRDIALLFIAERLGVDEAFQLAASVVLGEQGGYQIPAQLVSICPAMRWWMNVLKRTEDARNDNAGNKHESASFYAGGGELLSFVVGEP